MLDTIITSVVAVLMFLTAWIYERRHGEATRLAEEVDDLREKLKAAEDERDGWRETAESTHKLLQVAHERADRLAAMNQGLTEDLAAMKAYNPEEIEERLKKIREIRADEERNERMKREDELLRLWAAQSLMSSQYCSLGSALQIPLQSQLNIRMTPDGHYIGGCGL